MSNVVVNRLNKTYDAGDERLLGAVLATPGSSAVRSRVGRRPGGGLEVTVGGTPESATVAPGVGILTDGGAGGSFLFAVTAATSVNLAARPSGGTSRIDEVVVRVKNSDVRPADAAIDGLIEVITGTAGASPTAPTVPAGYLRLAELAVPATGSVSVSKAPQRIAAVGGIIPVASQAERDAIDVIYDGLLVYREDTKVYEARLNGAWITAVAAPRVQRGTASITGGATPSRSLAVALDNAIFGGGTPSNIQLTPRDSWSDVAHCYVASRGSNTMTIGATNINAANFSAGTPVTVDWVAWV